MTVLNRHSIESLRNEGKLAIEPFDSRNLGPNSYDVTLGEHFWLLEPRRQFAPRERYNPSDPCLNEIAYDPTSFYYGPVQLCAEDPAYQTTLFWNPYDSASKDGFRLVKAPTWGALAGCLGFKASRDVFKSDDLVFLLPPHATVFGHTVEFAGSTCAEFCTLLRSRSSWARVGVSFGGGAGWGDSGFFGRWGMRIVNHTPYAIPLLVGSRVAQLVFLRAEGEGSTYAGKYQESGLDVQQLKAAWRPESLLPQLWKDLAR
jgi:deoxycytidine triphosphate deaminase